MIAYETALGDPPDDTVLPQAPRAAPVLCESVAALEFSGVWTSHPRPADEAIPTAPSHTRQEFLAAGSEKGLKTLRRYFTGT